MSELRVFRDMVAQGDVLFMRVGMLPPHAKPVEKRGRVVVANSDSGHDHAINDVMVTKFEVVDELVSYLHIPGEHADVVHLRPHDTHETIRLTGGYWEVRRQREHTPEGWRRVED